MELEEIRHVPWNCRWGRFAGRTAIGRTAESDVRLWHCGHPELGAPMRPVLSDEWDHCRWWEASIVPPCAAMGWSQS